MAKKSKSKNSGGNTSNAKNIKALINQNKMVEQQNAEAERRKREEEEARAKAKLEREEALKAQAEKVDADQVISPEGEVVESKKAETPSAKEKEVKAEKTDKQKDLKSKQRKADPERRTIKKRIKETMSELKKVSWPSFKDVVKKTGVVLAVVIFFGIVLWIFDFVGHIFYNLLQGSPLI